MAYSAPRDTLLGRWARLAHRRRGVILLLWTLCLAALVVLSQKYSGEYAINFQLPGSETRRAVELLQEKFPAQAGDRAVLVFEAPAGMADPAIRARVEKLLASVAELPDVAAVTSPYAGPGAISRDGTIARAPVMWKHQAEDISVEQITAFVALADAAGGDGLRVEAGDEVVMFNEQPEFGSEMVGLLAAVVILLVAFGSVIAMGLPLGAAVFGLGAGFSIIGLGTNVLELPDFAPQFAMMIGLGVGIDYSLLVVTRFREGLHSGRSVEDSLVLAVTTSGRAVIFAGIVVSISFLGLYAMGLPFVAAMGTAGAVMVAVSVLVALTLTPSLMSLAGTRVDSWKVPFLHSTEGVDPASGWYRLSRAIQRRPVIYLVAAAGLLIALGSPLLSMELGFTDAGNNPEHLHSRRAYDLLSRGFGPGFNGPLQVVVDLSEGGTEKLEPLGAAIAGTQGVAAVAPPIVNEAGDAAIMVVFPTTSPQDSKTTDLVHRLRGDTIPPIAGDGPRVYVAGQTAAFIDIGDHIGRRLPYLFGGVIGLSFLLLVVVFRSILVAAKAAVMNLLSISAAYGVIVAVFQWGWGASLIGVEGGPVEVFIPMMLFAILFGLSMDYEVFLISRIREEYLSTRSNATAVANGLAATARVITAAAAIMVTVFFAFAFGNDRVVKEFGIGLGTAILVDATVVRLFLVPATMELLGEANWWLPRWLARILPQVNVEGAPALAHAAPAHAHATATATPPPLVRPVLPETGDRPAGLRGKAKPQRPGRP